MKKTFLMLSVLVFVGFSVPLLAHDEHHKSGDHNGHHEPGDHKGHHECVRYESKDAMPNLDAPPWEQLATINDFVFYRDASRPELLVAAMKIQGAHPVEGVRTRVSWQVGEEILTARIEVEEMVCVRSVIADDGSRRDLAGLYAVLLNRVK